MNAQDLTSLRRLGERLIASFRTLIAALPEDARGISGMSRYLNVHKATCQRVVEGSRCDDGLAAFVRFPGVKALLLVTEACRAQAMDSTLVLACEAAVRQLDQELESRALSLSGLVDAAAAVSASEAQPGAALEERRALNQRRALYGASRRLTGESVEAKVVVSLAMPSASRPGHLRALALSALLGVHRESFARPIVSFVVSGWWDGGYAGTGWTRRGHASGAGSGPLASMPLAGYRIVPEFSTAGISAVRIGETDSRTLLVVDVDPASRGGPVDVAVEFETDAPLSPLEHVSARLAPAARIVQPMQTLVMDVFVHRSLVGDQPARAACVALSAPPGDTREGGYEQVWYDRFPETVRVESVRSRSNTRGGRSGRAMEVAARLSEHLFRTSGLKPDDFRALRINVSYPVWQSEYRVYIEAPSTSMGAGGEGEK
jgi:hypothetical protein